MCFHPNDGEEEEPVTFLEDTTWYPDNEFLMVLIQPFDELEKASANLEKIGFYNNWPSDYYNGTVKKRQQYRRLRYGWNEKGKALPQCVPAKSSNTSLCAAIDNTGVVGYQIFESSMQQEDFLGFMANLVNCLKLGRNTSFDKKEEAGNSEIQYEPKAFIEDKR